MNERIVFQDFYDHMYSLPIDSVWKRKGEIILHSAHIKDLRWELLKSDIERIDDLLFPAEDLI